MRYSPHVFPTGLRYISRHNGAALPRPSRADDMPLEKPLICTKAKNDHLYSHDNDGHDYRRPALVTQSAEVWLLAHGNRFPSAGPAEKGVLGLGGVDGPKLAHSDDGEDGADKWSDDGGQAVEESLVAKLGKTCQP